MPEFDQVIRRLLQLGVVVLSLGFWSVSVATEPGKLVTGVMGDTFAVLDDRSRSQPEKAPQIRALLGERFDLVTISRGIIGPHWQLMTKQDRSHFVDLFTQTLVLRLIKVLDGFEQDMFHYRGQRIDKNGTARVYAELVDDRERWALTYRLWQRQGKWMVYDLSFTGFSLVKSYRRDYRRVIKSDGTTGLLQMLTDSLHDKDANQTSAYPRTLAPLVNDAA